MGGPLTSCIIIVRDEELHLRPCVESTRGLVDELIVLDTGSTDGTVELARSLGASVHHFGWIDDFAAARNAALEQTSGRWILVLDADDRLEGAGDLRAFLESDPELDVGLLLVESPLGAAPDAPRDRGTQPRLFRASCGVRYRFVVHELPMIDGLRRGPAPGRILHTGYVDPEVRRVKAERILRLLPGVADEHYRRYHACRALATLGRHDDLVQEAAGFAEAGVTLPPDIRVSIATLLVARGQAGAAIRLLTEGLEDAPLHPDLYLALWLAAGVGYVDRCERVLRGCPPEGPPIATLGHLDAVADAMFSTGLIDRPLRAAFAATGHPPPAGTPAPAPGSGAQQRGARHEGK